MALDFWQGIKNRMFAKVLKKNTNNGSQSVKEENKQWQPKC